MPNTNLCVIAGHLARDPEIKFIAPKGIAVCDFTVAVTNTYEKDGEQKETTDWVPCKAWRQFGEKAAKYKKGEGVYVVGSFRTEQWDDKETGKKRSKSYINVHSITSAFGGGKRKPEDDVVKPRQKAIATRAPEPEPEWNKGEDDVPF